MGIMTAFLFGRTIESEAITDDQWEALFADPVINPPHLGVERRRETRIEHQQVGQFFLDLGSNGRQRFVVRTRDLSAMGVGFVHAHPVEKGMRCRIVLLSREKRLVQRNAVVASCRQHDRVYMIGLQLDKPIEPEQFLPRDGAEETDSSMWLS